MSSVAFGILGVLSLVSLFVQGVLYLCVRRKLSRRQPPSSHRPPVTVLRPVCGLDDGFEANLISICAQDYPRFEVIVVAARGDDPALPVVRRIQSLCPNGRLRIVIGSPALGANPKVSNLIHASRWAQHEWLLISDSNVSAHSEYLNRMMDEAAAPGVGMVANLVVGVGAETLGAQLENMQLSGYLLSATAAAEQLLGVPCVMGKSMLFRRSDLDAVGGFAKVSEILAEDYVLAREFRRAGKGVVISSDLLRTVNSKWTLDRYFSRHLRWNQLRAKIAPSSYATELLSTPTVPLLFATLLAVREGWAEGVIVSALLLLLRILLEALTYRLTWRDRPLGCNLPLLVLLRDLSMAAIWLLAPLKTTVSWRGRRYRLGHDSRIEAPPSELRRSKAFRAEAT